MASAANRDSRHHTQIMQRALQQLMTHLREDIGRRSSAPVFEA